MGCDMSFRIKCNYPNGRKLKTKNILKDYIDELQEQKKWHLRYDEDLNQIRMVFWFN